MSKRNTIERFQEIAKSKGGKLLSETYKDAHTKYLWECKQGHRWFAKANKIQQGRWCQQCYGNIPHDIQKLRDFAASKEGKCLSEVYINNRTKYTWQCKLGHIWQAPSKPVIQQKHWCPECAKVARAKSNIGRSKYSLSDLHKIAEEKGGKCLSEQYLGYYAKYKWQCKNGHIWETDLSTVIRFNRKSSWCPSCPTQRSKPQTDIYNKVKEIFSDALESIRGKLPNKKFELDIFIPSLNKAIEFNGEYWHSLPGSSERDQRKLSQAKQVGIDILVVKERDFINNKNSTINNALLWLEGKQ